MVEAKNPGLETIASDMLWTTATEYVGGSGECGEP